MTRFKKATDRAMKVSPAEPDRAAAVVSSPEQIAARAFELYLARGGEPGRELEDWFRAEAELRNQNQR